MELMREGNKAWGKASAGAGAFILQRKVGMICTLFTVQNSKEGIFLRYRYEFKRTAVGLYRQGKWADTPSGVKEQSFHATCAIQDSIHVFSLVHKYVSKILGTYHYGIATNEVLNPKI